RDRANRQVSRIGRWVLSLSASTVIVTSPGKRAKRRMERNSHVHRTGTSRYDIRARLHKELCNATGVLVPLMCWRCEHADAKLRCGLRRMIDALRGLLKILLVRLVDVAEGLRVAIDQREPRALNLDHDAMPASEGVEDVWHRPIDGCGFARS